MSSDYRYYFVVRINVTIVILSINAINIIMHIDKRDVYVHFTYDIRLVIYFRFLTRYKI